MFFNKVFSEQRPVVYGQPHCLGIPKHDASIHGCGISVHLTNNNNLVKDCKEMCEEYAGCDVYSAGVVDGKGVCTLRSMYSIMQVVNGEYNENCDRKKSIGCDGAQVCVYEQKDYITGVLDEHTWEIIDSCDTEEDGMQVALSDRDMTCVRNVNYGYEKCDSAPEQDRILSRCGVTIEVPDIKGSTEESLAKLMVKCAELCDKDEGCDFFYGMTSWNKSFCTKKSIAGMIAASNLDIHSPITDEFIAFCSSETPKAQYEFLSLCGNDESCAYKKSPGLGATGAKVCTNWDVVNTCTTPNPIPPKPTGSTALDPTNDNTTNDTISITTAETDTEPNPSVIIPVAGASAGLVGGVCALWALMENSRKKPVMDLHDEDVDLVDTPNEMECQVDTLEMYA